jgi:hypothetical protein
MGVISCKPPLEIDPMIPGFPGISTSLVVIIFPTE